MKLKTGSDELYFNPQLISLVHLSSDRTSLTVHFVNGTYLTAPAETDDDRTSMAEFLGKLTDEIGFLVAGNELLNLKSALWISIPGDGPIQVHSADNRTHSLPNQDPERIRRMLAD